MDIEETKFQLLKYLKRMLKEPESIHITSVEVTANVERVNPLGGMEVFHRDDPVTKVLGIDKYGNEFYFIMNGDKAGFTESKDKPEKSDFMEQLKNV